MRTSRTLVRGMAGGAIAILAGCALTPLAARTLAVRPPTPPPSVPARVTTETTVARRPSVAPLPTTSTIPTVVAAPVSATGNPELDALLPTLAPVLFDGGAQVHFGYNPVDCCHAGGYNPELNEVWVSERALGRPGALVYVTAHELAHSVHLTSGRGPALTTAVAGAPSVRAGSPWDESEKVADCVAWALYPEATAAAGLTYWSCPDPWRAQVLAALG